MEYFSEKVLENRLRIGVKKLGGLCLKWVSPGNNGVPDRIILMPGGRVYFIELKSTGKIPRPLQLVWGRDLIKMGFYWEYIDKMEEVLRLLKKLEHDLRTT